MQITWTNYSDKMPPDDEVIITECCNAQILMDQRYCPKCGYECRIYTRKMEGADKMSQQCGKCRFWDRDLQGTNLATGKLQAYCNAIVPFWAGESDSILETEGHNCPVYEERKELPETPL